MGISNLIFLNLFVICWLAFAGHYQVTGGGSESLSCLQKLLPCQKYLMGSSTTKPPAACCVPLKEMVVSNTQCLCAVFKNEGILKTLNVTKDDALNLAKACGANADVSVCSEEAASPASPSTSVAPSSNDSGASEPPTTNAGTAVSHVGRPLLAALILGFIILIF